ncbi:MAG: hypothetical protein VYA80_02780 [Pseudomonadota bacterium]|nr:hypothetical protein [Pseudomonadota bacterium]
MKKVLIALVAFAASSVVLAGGHASASASPNYTYLELGYLKGLSIGGNDGDGFAISGSYAIDDKWHVAYTNEDWDEAIWLLDTSDIDVDTFTLGVSPALNASTDLVFEVSYVDGDIDGIDFDGFEVSTGIRSMIASNVELNAAIASSNVDIDGFDIESVALSVGAQYSCDNGINVGVDHDVSNGATNFGLRYNF